MTSEPTQHYYADVVIIGFGAAGGCAAIEAHDAGANVVLLEKQPEATHYSNTRMSGGGFHSPSPAGEWAAIKAYAQAMFSGENLPHKLEGEQPEFSDALAAAWATYAPQNDAFMRGLDPQFQTFRSAGAAFPDFPGADRARYACLRSTYTGAIADMSPGTKDAAKTLTEAGEAFHTCLLTGVQARNIPIHYDTSATALRTNDAGEVTGVTAVRDGQPIVNHARRAVLITSGGYEYNPRMRKAFLDGHGKEGWAFYGSPANTGDGIRMALKIGAALAKIGSVAGRVMCAIPERRLGLKIGLNTSSVGKPHEIVVDNHGRRYAAERRITKDPSCYIFYKEALQFDTVTLTYPRIPSWMMFDTTLMNNGALVSASAASYNGIDWDQGNHNALRNGWIVQGATLAELAANIRAHPDNRATMDAATLTQQVETWNRYCAAQHDPDFDAEPDTMEALHTPPYYAIPLYPGGPNTKGGLRANARREVLDWDDTPIPRPYAAGEICSVFQFVYQGGGNLAECIVFGRIAGQNAAAEVPLETASNPHGGAGRMANKIRLGFVGANVRSVWAAQSHYPALLASPDVEWTAVCTSRPESAEEARRTFGAKLAFHDYREMVASPEIDAVAVVVRVPEHYGPTKAAIEAGKHVYTEWPLGRTTAEAEELTALAQAKGVQTAVGLQSRVSPTLLYIRELLETGYVGEMLSCHASAMRDGALERPSSRTWQRDASLGANTLTIATGHVIDALRFVAGNFARVACLVTTQARQWYETDTKQMVPVTAPDNVLVSGQLARGAVASVHAAAVPWAGSGFRMEIYGREGTLVATGSVSSQRGETLRLQGVRGSHALSDLEVPERFVYVPADFPRGDPFNVGQMYALFAEAIHTGQSRIPTFDTAVELHRFIDTIQQASDTGRELPVA